MDNYSTISFNYDIENQTPNEIIDKCIIKFYRSEKQAKKMYGKNDTGYNGEFGFDTFIPAIYPSSQLHGNSAYKLLGGVVPKEVIIPDFRKYPCPYLTIWPPDVEGNPNNKKSKVTIYVMAEPALNQPEIGNFSIRFESSNPHILIKGKEIYSDSMEIGVPETLDIECKGAFGADVYIDAYVIEGEGDDEEKVPAGRLVIPANNRIYITELIQVIIRVKQKKLDVNGNVLKDANKMDVYEFLDPNYPTDIKNFCKNDLPNYLNDKSFNQALIHINCSEANIKDWELKRDDFQANMHTIFATRLGGDENQKLEFMDNIEQLYLKDFFNSSIEYKKNEAKKQSQINEKLRNFIQVFGDNFAYNRGDNIRTAHSNGIAFAAMNHPDVCIALKEYEDAKAEYQRLLGLGSLTEDDIDKLNKNEKIHVFYFADIDSTAPVGGGPGDALAFSPTGKGTAYIFRGCVGFGLNKEFVTHEIGHAFGLIHTFKSDDSIDSEVYKKEGYKDADYFAEKLKNLNSSLDSAKKKLRELKSPGSELEDDLAFFYAVIKQKSKNNNVYEYDIKHCAILPDRSSSTEEYREIDNFISLINSAIDCESTRRFDTPVDQTKVNEKEKEITDLELQIAQLNTEKATLVSENELEPTVNLEKNKKQSYTLENYMDYKDYSAPTSGNTENPDFQYKMFNYVQWEEIHGKGDKYLRKLYP